MKIEIANKEEFIEEIVHKVLQNISKKHMKLAHASIPDELTTLDVQHYFNVSGSTVRKWRLEGLLEYRKEGQKYYYSGQNILDRIAEGKLRININKLKYL